MESAVRDMIDIDEKIEKRKIPWVEIQKVCCYAAAAFLIGRAAAFGYLFPFATAFAVAAINRDGKNVYVGVFVCLGIWSNMLSKYCLGETSMVVIINCALFLFLGTRYKIGALSAGIIAAVVTGCVKYLFCRSLGAVFVYDAFMIITEVFAVLAFVYIFSKLISVVEESKVAEHSLETKASVIVGIAVGLAGLGGLSVYGMNVGYTGIMVIVLIGSSRGGIGGGGLTGILAGTVTTIISFANPAVIGLLGFSGVAAGFFKGQWRIYSVICFSIINVVLTVFKAFGAVQASYYEILAACVIFLLIPSKWIEKTDFIFSPIQYAQTLAERNFLSGMEKKIWEYENAFRNLSEIYTRTAERKKEDSVDYNIEVYNKVKDAICEQCNLKVDCLEIYNGRTEKYLKELLHGEEDADKRNGFACKERLGVALYMKSLLENLWLDHKWRIKIESSRELMAAQFKGMAESIGKLGDDLHQFDYEEKKAFENIEIGISKYAKDAIVCGDSCMGTKLNDQEYLVALSDGMGSGSKAAGESLLTINTLLYFLKAGFREELALTAINSILILKSTEEIFATVDMGILNARTGILKLYKMGAAAAYIKRGEGVEMIKYASLPVGIIGKVRVDSIERKVEIGDIIIMVSDGITDADTQDGESKWLIDLIKNMKTKDPQKMADLIMSSALEKYNEKEKDDMTVLTVKVK